MISDETLGNAVTTGVITAAQAVQLRDLEDARLRAGAEPVDDEKLRFLSGFGDVFVAIGIVLFLFATGYFLFRTGSSMLAWPGLAVTSWLLAEFFTRRRRMALPSILLLVTFVCSIMFAAFQILAELTGAPQLINYYELIRGSWPLVTAGAGLITALAAAAHYLRFRVPITVAAGVCALVFAITGLLRQILPDSQLVERSVTFLLGCAVFALAMRFDLSDPERLTKRTDIAFWLHMLAAPMIVGSLLTGTVSAGAMDGSVALGILAVFLLLGIVALIIDRRALLVSGLLYAAFSFAALLRASGITDLVVPSTMLILGAFVLLLSAGWHSLRAAILKLLPADLARKLPHPPAELEVRRDS